MATPTITIPIYCYKGKQLHKKKTTVIMLTGPGAAKTAPTTLASTIYGHGKVRTEGINELYRMENPTRWFFTLKDQILVAVYEAFHDTSCTLHRTSVKAKFQHLERERERITINWLPFTIEGLRPL